MNHKELYQLVRDVPEDATPMIYYDPSAETWRDTKNHAQVFFPLAEAAFVGSMVRHLRNKHKQVFFGSCCEGKVFVNIPGNLGHFYDTEIAALAAACKATKQGGGA